MRKSRSIQFWITAAFVFLSLLVLTLVSFMLYNKFSVTAERSAELGTQQIVQQVAFNLLSYLNGTAETFNVVDNKISETRRFPDQQLQRELNTVLATREDMVSIAFFDRAGKAIAASPDAKFRRNTNVTTQDWFLQALKHPEKNSFTPPHVQNLFKGQYPWVISLSKGQLLEQDGQPVEGVLVLDVNFKTIDSLMGRVSLGKKGYAYIIDLDGNIVYHPQQQLIYSELKSENVARAIKEGNGSYKEFVDGEMRMTTVQALPEIGWKLVGISFMDEAVTTKKEMTTFMLRLMLGVIIVVWPLAYWLSSKLSRPIKRLEQSVKLVERGDFSSPIHARGYDEVEKLSGRFNIMVTRIRELMGQIVEEQEGKRKKEFEVLQSQINPHFLYNTLNSVVRLAGSGKNEEVVRMITSLSKLFRISLGQGHSVILIREELEHVRSYLTIQEMRFKGKFSFSIEASEAVLACQTVKLVLQPIVENAIYHGIEKMVDPGHIHITAECRGERIRFSVKDNGLGIPSDRLMKLPYGVQSGGGSGVGLRNVHERIQLFFGNEYGLEFWSELEEGTEVAVWFPRTMPDTAKALDAG